MAQSAKSTGGANPPFASPSGQAQNQGATGKGGHNFLTDPTGGGEKSGGRDFTKESRPQPPMRTQAGLPNSESIPEGGKILKADPGKVSVGEKAGGIAKPIGSVPRPFRGLK